MRTLLCGIAKLENNYIREWVEYHKKIGFTNIVLYDNNDLDGETFDSVIGDYVDSGFVILKDWRGRSLAQIPAYNSCYNEYKNDYDWIAYWDIDEFIEFDKCKTIGEFLNQSIFENEQSIRLCWKQYTDNGLLRVNNGNYSVTRFTEVFDKNYCFSNSIPIINFYVANTQSKAILRTNIEKINITSPHVHSVTKRVVDATGHECKDGIKMSNNPIWKGAWINHYRFKTIDEYVKQKMVRLWPTSYKNGGKDGLNLDFFFQYNKKTKEKEELAKNLISMKRKFSHKALINTWVRFDKNGKLLPNNWGDELNFNFLGSIFDVDFVLDNKKDCYDNYCLIGSILNNRYVDNNTIIWGSGIQDETIVLERKPKKVLAVRGPLTRKFLMDQGINCPEVYGDPSVLLPYFYYPNVTKKYEIGLIPHWESLNSKLVEKLSQDERVHLIKMKGYGSWTDLIDEILSCKYIVSESLHGLIMAESYGIPNLWCNITLNKYEVKFHDYFLSIGLDRCNPFPIREGTLVENLLSVLKFYKKGNGIDIDKLIAVCPFEFKQDKKDTIKENNTPKNECLEKLTNIKIKPKQNNFVIKKEVSNKLLKTVKPKNLGKRYSYSNVSLF